MYALELFAGAPEGALIGEAGARGKLVGAEILSITALQSSTNSKIAPIQSHGLAADDSLVPHLGQNGLPGSPTALHLRQIMS
jgi:hypothetical protein